jgi:outer membrane protein assembly factor BamB
MKRFRFVFALFLGSAALVCSALATDILTNRGNNARTGLNAHETILTKSLVSSSSFGRLYTKPVDGQVYAQPLYVSNQVIIVNGASLGTHNVLYVATENDSLYAFDADSGVEYWRTSVAPSGETAVSATSLGPTPIQPIVGITATPVIDRASGPHGTIFVVAMTASKTTPFIWRIHAIDLATGADRVTPPPMVSASVKGKGPADTFKAQSQLNRPGILQLNGVIYTCWGGFGDTPPYSGWIIAYSENSLSMVGVFNTDPNGPQNETADHLHGSGNSIWQSGNGPAVDSDGHVFVATGNGPFDALNASGFPALRDYGDSVIKLNVTGGINVYDYFTPFNQATINVADKDLGSGGPMVLDIADTTGHLWKLLYQAGKDGNIYLLNRNYLGKFNPDNNQIYQEIPNGVPNGVWSSPAYFNGSIYAGLGFTGGTGPLIQLQFDFTNPQLPRLKPAPVSSTAVLFNYPGATPTISANGTTNGIVWAYDRNAQLNAVLYAFDATNLKTQLFSSGVIGSAVKFAVPTVCNGKVFVGTANSIAAFGKK